MSARARTRVYPGKTTSLGDKNDILKNQNQVTSRRLELGRFGRADPVKPVTGTEKANMEWSNSWYRTHL